MRTLGHEPSLICFFPSDYSREWTDNKRADLSLPPFHAVRCVYFPCILNLPPLKSVDGVCGLSVRRRQLQRHNKRRLSGRNGETRNSGAC